MRTRLATLRGAGVSATVVLALLVLGCVFVAMAGPRASLSIRTRALRQAVGRIAPAGTAISATTVKNDFTGGETTGSLVSPDDLSTVKQEMRRQLAAAGIPVGSLATTWASLTVPFVPVGGAGPGAHQAVLGPKLEVLYRDTLRGQGRLIAGRYTGGPSVAGHRIPVLVTQRTAARFGVHPGSELTLPSPAKGTVTLAVSGVIAPRDPDAAFWTADSVAAAPALNDPTGRSFWTGSAFVDAAGLPALERAFALAVIPMQWDFPLRLAHLGADQAPRLTTRLAGLGSLAPELAGSLAPAGQSITFSPPGVTGQLEDFLIAQAAVDSVLSLVFTGLAVIGAAALLLAAQMMTRRRAVEYTMLRARGASLRQLAFSILRDVAIAVIPAAAAGVAAAVALTPGSSAALAVWLAAGTVAVALAGPPVAVMVQQRTVRRGSRAAASRRTGTLQPAGTAPAPRRLSIGRVVVEVGLAAAAVGGLALLRYEGLSASGGVNAFTSAAPVLVAVPAALCLLRLYPLAMRAVLRLSARRAGVTGFVAAAWAGRASAATILPSFALVLALTLAAFAGMVRNAVTAGEVTASWRSAGADATVVPAGDGTLTPAVLRDLSRVPGVQHVAAVSEQPWLTVSGQTVTVLAVDPARYSALVASTPWPAVPAGKLAEPAAGTGTASGAGATVAPVLAAPSAARMLGTGKLLDSAQGKIMAHVAGLLSGTPALPHGGTYIVVPSWALPAAARAQPPDLMLVTGPHLDGAAFTSDAHRLVSGAVVTLRAAALDRLTGSPLPRGAYLGFAAGIGAAAGFSVVVLLLDLALGAEERKMTLARLSTMGLRTGQARRLTLMETLPAVLAAALAGVACALVLVPLTGPVLDLSVFTGSAAPVPIRPGWAALGVPIAGLVGLAVATLLLHIQVERRRGVTAAMRVGQ